MNKQLVVWLAGNKPEKRFTDKHWHWLFEGKYIYVIKHDKSKQVSIPVYNVLYVEEEIIKDIFDKEIERMEREMREEDDGIK